MGGSGQGTFKSITVPWQGTRRGRQFLLTLFVAGATR